MIKRMVWEWEMLDESTRRAKVMGGWILQSHLVGSKKTSLSESMVFITDPYHEWMIVPPVIEEKVERANNAKEFAA